MKKALTKTTNKIYYYKDGVRTEGVHEGIRGNMSGISGNVNGISGDVYDCEITGEEREKGIDISDLVA